MLKRIYVENYKCLVNFELTLHPINLFLGANGAGKSSVFEVLQNLRSFIGGEGKLEQIFKHTTLTRWQTSHIQTFEIEMDGKEGIYKYGLKVDYDIEGNKARVKSEILSHNEKPLLRFEQGEVHLYRDNHSEGPVYPFDWHLSAVSSIFARPDNKLLTWFKEQVSHIIVVQPNPALMVEISEIELDTPSYHLENFVSWYRHLSQDQGFAIELNRVLQDVLPGFDAFRFEKSGDQYRFKAHFQNENRNESIGYGFGDLSDGQRMLIVLYALTLAAKEQHYILCLDEPENFLALPEIQPWLIQLFDLSQKEEAQALLISHHPELINYLLASPVGFWFERGANTPVRVRPIAAEQNEGMPVSELIARGWLHD
jgi:predicted ATPase